MAKKKHQSVSEEYCASYDTVFGRQEESLLSPVRAFVVQFREEPEATLPCFRGRVEHMTSGRATRFHSPKDLLAFFAQVLTAIHAKPP